MNRRYNKSGVVERSIATEGWQIAGIGSGVFRRESLTLGLRQRERGYSASDCKKEESQIEAVENIRRGPQELLERAVAGNIGCIDVNGGGNVERGKGKGEKLGWGKKERPKS